MVGSGHISGGYGSAGRNDCSRLVLCPWHNDVKPEAEDDKHPKRLEKSKRCAFTKSMGNENKRKQPSSYKGTSHTQAD